MLRFLLIACALAGGVSCSSAFADAITLGNNTNGTSVPFTGSVRYQQFFGSSLFAAVGSNPISINSIQFFQRANSKIDNTFYSVAMATTTKASSELIDDFDANRTSASHVFFSSQQLGTTKYTSNQAIAFAENPFTYAPAAGNLLIYVQKAVDSSDGNLTAQLFKSAPQDTNYAMISDLVPLAIGEGLVMQVDYTAVPEPTSAMLLVAGSLLMLGRRRRSASS